MSKRIEKIMKKYTERDMNALKSIYDFRCLSFEQLYHLYYKESILRKGDVSSEYLRKKIIKFKADGFIEEYRTYDRDLNMVYCLAPDGIKCIKTYFAIADNKYDIEKRIVKRGYYTYSEVKVAPRFLAHQHNLNSFALSATNLMNQLNIEYMYTDERYIPDTSAIRPDGIISLNNVDIYLEMDMGTESLSQLESKWGHYRTYLNSKNINKKIIIFFICKNKSKMEDRLNLIKHSVNQNILDCFNYDIDMHIGTPEKLISVFKNLILPLSIKGTNSLLLKSISILKEHKFKIVKGTQVSKYINDTSYRYYIIGEESQKEFLVQDFFGESIVAIHRASYHNQNNVIFKKNTTRDIDLIIIGTSEDQIISAINSFEIPYNEHVFYTTINRLSTMPLNEALFMAYSNNQDIYCFEPDMKSIKATTKLSKKD